TLAEARTARGEGLAKIAATEVPGLSGPRTVLQEQRAAGAEYRRHAQWARLSPLVESLEQCAEDEPLRARESLTAGTAPPAVRAGSTVGTRSGTAWRRCWSRWSRRRRTNCGGPASR